VQQQINPLQYTQEKITMINRWVGKTC